VVGYLSQGAAPKADVVLVIDRTHSPRGYVYTCYGRPLDLVHVATGVEPFLRKTDTGATMDNNPALELAENFGDILDTREVPE
jgi:hypothetical protein